MSLANSNGPRWIREQHAAAEKRREGIGPIRDFLARLLRGGAAPPPRPARPVLHAPDEDADRPV